MSDKHSLILEFLGLSPEEWQDHRVEEHFAKEYGALAKLLDQHAAEQRKICAHDGSKAAVEYKGKYIGDHVHFACLNAVEKRK